MSDSELVDIRFALCSAPSSCFVSNYMVLGMTSGLGHCFVSDIHDGGNFGLDNDKQYSGNDWAFPQL